MLVPGLAVLFCGINPGRWSGAAGHHFANPQNRFWRALHDSGFTPDLFTPATEDRMLAAGLGVTNLVDRTTAGAAELTSAELRLGAARLEDKVRRFAPRVVCFLGLGAYRGAFGRPGAVAGRQPEQLAEAAVWLVVNPSPLQARYPLAVLVAQLTELRQWLAGPPSAAP